MEVAGVVTQILLDNGAEFSALSLDYCNHNLSYKGYRTETAEAARTANQAVMPVLFAVWLPIVVNNYVVEVLFKVIPKLAVRILFGQNVLQKCDIKNSINSLIFPVGRGITVDVPIQVWSKDKDISAPPNSQEYLLMIGNGERLTEGMNSWGLCLLETKAMNRIRENLQVQLNKERENRLAKATTEAGRLKDIQEWESFSRVVLDHPCLFDENFRAGILKIPPQKLSFKNLEVLKEPRCTKLRPLSHKEMVIVQK